ncbi:hypothetical protein FNW52_18095 [Flavobacterium sp. ZT3R18]|uniref:hypothetical protein n=1 Tax=Flavobacterium sp. ZT3R18 TaxID=2594429 RepID=UPI00117B163D|nr:hypothetical protein [Flavobacterium sp. ZT3R18]TRX31904.1 hypothetical protein FNW52_18095 [Flavobacterium sp. ZT3R18]
MSNIIFGSPSFVVPPAGQIDAQATVMFRPNPRWKGEFMFDWMRTGSGTNLGQTSLDGDVDYQTILGYYDNNQAANTFVEDSTDTNNDGVKDLYGRLKGEYRIFTSLNRLDPAGHNIDYFEPKLCIYKHENETTKAVAILQLQIEVTVAPEELILEFENEFFEITLYTGTPPATPTLISTPAAPTTPPVQPQERMKQLQITKTLTTGTFNTLEIQVECKKTFATGYKEITAYTVMSNPDPASSQKVRKLAGTLKVLPNDKTKRKVKNIVLVNVKTDVNVDGTAEEGFKAGTITIDKQKAMIRKTLRQALIDPIFIIEELDISTIRAGRDDLNHRYVDAGKLKCYYDHRATTIPTGWKSLSDYLFEKLVLAKGNRYNNYMRVFYVAQGCFTIDKNNLAFPSVGILTGYTDGANPKNIVMTKDAELPTLSHEVLHSLKLPHTWESKNHMEEGTSSNTVPQAKHSLKYMSTNNIMDYGTNKYFLYYWQCIVANNNASAEPPNYTPAP